MCAPSYAELDVLSGAAALLLENPLPSGPAGPRNVRSFTNETDEMIFHVGNRCSHVNGLAVFGQVLPLKSSEGLIAEK